MQRTVLAVVGFALFWATQAIAATSVFTTNLIAPVKVAVTRSGNLVVTEAGTGANDGRISVVDSHGIARTLVDGLPSGPAAPPPNPPSGPSALQLRHCCTLDVAIGDGDTLRQGAIPGSEVPNPVGPSSPIFSSVLRMTFSGPVDQLAGGFSLTMDDHNTLLDGFTVRLRNAHGERARIKLISDLKDFRPDPITIVRGSNPFGMTGRWDRLLVADAGQNAIVEVRNSGRTKTLLRFAPVPNPLPFGPPVSDAVPTAVRAIHGHKHLVTLFAGFPFAPGTGSVQLVDTRVRTETPLITGLTSPTDVLKIKHGIYVLELTGDLMAGPPPLPGRLLRFKIPSSAPEVITEGLIGPTGMEYSRYARAIFVAENFTGRIIRVQLD